jgi:hypothetical protein
VPVHPLCQVLLICLGTNLPSSLRGTRRVYRRPSRLARSAHQRRLGRNHHRGRREQHGGKSWLEDAPQVDLKCHGVQPGVDPHVIVKTPVVLEQLTASCPPSRYYLAEISHLRPKTNCLEVQLHHRPNRRPARVDPSSRAPGRSCREAGGLLQPPKPAAWGAGSRRRRQRSRLQR